MTDVEKASISFSGFRITKSLLEIKDVVGQHLSIGIDPSGELNRTEKSFHLFLKVRVSDDKDNLNIEVEIHSDFKFDAELENSKLEDYLYLNSPAILFPHIRAFIASLTALSGSAVVTLPPMNLEGLKNILKGQTKIIE